MEIKSNALQANISDHHIDVEISSKYKILQESMSVYCGLTEGFDSFLRELSHPYKNWGFIVKEARKYSLDYFFLLKKHPEGEWGVALYIELYIDSVRNSVNPSTRVDAVDNLIVYLKKVLKESGDDVQRFKPALDMAFKTIRGLKDSEFEFFVNSYFSIKKISREILSINSGLWEECSEINLLLQKYLTLTYSFWMLEKDPVYWLKNYCEDTVYYSELEYYLSVISHKNISRLCEKADSYTREYQLGSRELLKQLTKLPGYNSIVKHYVNTIKVCFSEKENEKEANRIKLLFLFYSMSINGLASVHEDIIREIGSSLSWLIANEDKDKLRELISATFQILKEQSCEYPGAALNCVMSTGEEIYKTDDYDFVNFFIDNVIELGFQAPLIEGVGDDWQIKANKYHVHNIRVWLKIINIKPQWSSRLLSALIIHLTLSGIFIKDTDLFPRDITRLLNSKIEPVYNLIKQLSKLFPAYFNDIGAEGELREISTKLDEISGRQDVLIHFIRKQSHVESNNRIIFLMEAALKFWVSGNKIQLKPYLPKNIYEQIDDQGEFVDGVRAVLRQMIIDGYEVPEGLLKVKGYYFKKLINNAEGLTEKDVERVELAIKFYTLLFQKYNPGPDDITGSYLSQISITDFPRLSKIDDINREERPERKILKLLLILKQLKEVINSHKTYEIREEIYHKRHFAVDIPSMYGSYSESKFNALGLTFRIEAAVNILFEELVDKIDLSLVTKATFAQIYDRLVLFHMALKIDGINSREFQTQLDFLTHALQSSNITFTQYLDIFKGFAGAVKNITNDHINNIHEKNLSRILKITPKENLSGKYKTSCTNLDQEKFEYMVSEVFFREKIALSFGLPQLDLFLTRILKTLFNQADELPEDKLHLLLNYDPKKAMTLIDKDKNLDYGIVSLGNKGLNLYKMRSFDWSVPPGLIVTTEVFTSRELIAEYEPARENFNIQLRRLIEILEKKTGKMFGNPENPLLFSVRSGSSISQPGMMDTFLNVGINEEIAEGIAEKTKNSWFAWDNYRRFLQCYGMASGIGRNKFDSIINEYKQKLGLLYKRDLSGDQMKGLALLYKKYIKNMGVILPSNPFTQLLVSIKKVFDSWESERARSYRMIMGISGDWGTAVTLQAMVYGNMSENSGSGVLFTHSPRLSGDSMVLWGDFTVGNQGEDVVSGLVKTLPVSKIQICEEQRDTEISLETHFPEIYGKLREYAEEMIYEKGWSPQEIEFTFESPRQEDLYLLQTRDMVIRDRKNRFVFEPSDELLSSNYLGHGIGVSGGAMAGRIVYTLEDIDMWRDLEPDTSLILIRGDTVPDDIREINAADGLLTARGGMTSHASVVAHRLEKTCVVGCSALKCNESEKKTTINRNKLYSGDLISIDGHEGSIYLGEIKIREA